MPAGVLNQQDIEKLVGSVIVSNKSSTTQLQIDASAMDLPLGEKYYEMEASCRPQDLLVDQLINDHARGGGKHLGSGTVLFPGNVYLIETDWSLELPNHHICVRCTARSSVGRLDVLVRLVTDRADEFDKVRDDRKSRLYVEVVPISFPIKVAPGQCLSQLRFIKGPDKCSLLGREVLDCEDEPVLVDKHGEKLENLKTANDDDYGILLSLNLEKDEHLGCVGFVAKTDPNEGRDAINPDATETERYDPPQYWSKVETEPKHDKAVIIKKNRFYIFRSLERFQLPAHIAVDAHAYSETLGDIRIHYAGFAHPFFGHKKNGNGTPLIFEVRGHNMDTILRDGDALAKIYFRRMSTPAAEPEQPEQKRYNDQELKLSACFKEWPA